MAVDGSSAPLVPYVPFVVQVDASAPRVGAPGSQVAAVEHLSVSDPCFPGPLKPSGQMQCPFSVLHVPVFWHPWHVHV